MPENPCDPDVLARLRLLLPADDATPRSAGPPAAPAHVPVGPSWSGAPDAAGVPLRVGSPPERPVESLPSRIGPPAAFRVDGTASRGIGPPRARSYRPAAPARPRGKVEASAEAAAAGGSSAGFAAVPSTTGASSAGPPSRPQGRGTWRDTPGGTEADGRDAVGSEADGHGSDEFRGDGRGPGPAGGGLTGLGAFDPGRRGVKALAAVAVVVVLVAASLAWRARPRVDPVPAADAAATGAVSDAGAAGGDPGGTPRGDTRAGGTAEGASGSGAAQGGSAPAGSASSVAGPADEVVVAVGGKVRKPGLVRLPPGSRVADAVQAAGGAHSGVDVVLLNPARKVVDGELILVGVTPPPGLPAPAAAGTSPTGAAASGGGTVNLNTATPAELDTLPGVGPVLAQRIIEHRERRGTFGAVSDLRQVEGIGNARYEQLKALVTV